MKGHRSVGDHFSYSTYNRALVAVEALMLAKSRNLSFTPAESRRPSVSDQLLPLPHLLNQESGSRINLVLPEAKVPTLVGDMGVGNWLGMLLVVDCPTITDPDSTPMLLSWIQTPRIELAFIRSDLAADGMVRSDA